MLYSIILLHFQVSEYHRSAGKTVPVTECDRLHDGPEGRCAFFRQSRLSLGET
jgi:hypothetical protein